MNKILFLIPILAVNCYSIRPQIECFDPNKFSADTTIYVGMKDYRGFIFPENYQPFISLDGDDRFTPTIQQVAIAELKLIATNKSYSRQYSRQYLGSIGADNDSILTILFLKNAIKNEECFDKIAAIGFGDKYEKFQRLEKVKIN